jgi:cell fate (sporulation/competence/biofilm development) regulator YlbF (YheA/YmcA/DUF963 family)
MEAKELFQKFTSLRRDYREKQLKARKPKPELLEIITPPKDCLG